MKLDHEHCFLPLTAGEGQLMQFQWISCPLSQLASIPSFEFTKASKTRATLS